ncbi:hypothetical protein SPBR_09229 [Sporothrix brasiliensis 5110]|uniref:Uncharacterized protein n=1 Tax=Sporothrix brasiliensis 5110 TaxID=1398154 RepID=A0A0C2JA62_9PEZI|nr:uncharacterized protein SPBR_09229 [Sporothrix brasiliensis 5110]KIH93807.1 hypothetical protein SPBR_09229 [Sporothrix brasiliensis 5110]
MPNFASDLDANTENSEDQYQDQVLGAGTCGDKSMIAPETCTVDNPGATTLPMARPGLKGLFEPAGTGVLSPHIAVFDE